MPHAENEATMGEPSVNGEKPSSQFISHLTSYPVVSDSITVFKSNPYGQKSLDLADQGYARFAKPLLPYLSKPYAYLAPYVAKADSLGDKGLSRVDLTFPIVKEDTEKIKGTIIGYVTLPIRVADNGKKHIFDIYSTQYKNTGSQGAIAHGKAAISTGLTVTSESLAWLSGILHAKKEEAEEIITNKTN